VVEQPSEGPLVTGLGVVHESLDSGVVEGHNE
jgi:hypothetical protein